MDDWKDAATHRQPKWPLRGYAPGNYTSVCRVCEQRFINMDKRAWHCLPCAIEEAQFLIESKLRALSPKGGDNG